MFTRSELSMLRNAVGDKLMRSECPPGCSDIKPLQDLDKKLCRLQREQMIEEKAREFVRGAFMTMGKSVTDPDFEIVVANIVRVTVY